MSTVIAGNEDLDAVRRLLQLGRYVYANIADEDLPGVVERGMTLLGGGRDHPWGAFVVDPEKRPASLPAHAPNRAQVRAIALRHGPWTEDGVAELTRGLAQQIGEEWRPLQAMVYATEPWLQRALVHAGFERIDTVIYFRLPLRGAGFAFGPSAPGNGFFSARYPSESGRAPAGEQESPAFALRAAQPSDIPTLAELDARAFDSYWHYPANDLLELMMRGRLMIAERDDVIAGYSGLLLNSGGEAHLARLAVNPDFQGQGVGRTLLLDAIREARDNNAREFALNTQLSNQRSQSLYRSVGMQETGIRLPVYLLTIPAQS